jgi:hypothetical protein
MSPIADVSDVCPRVTPSMATATSGSGAPSGLTTWKSNRRRYGWDRSRLAKTRRDRPLVQLNCAPVCGSTSGR